MIRQKASAPAEIGKVYCPMCTHTVDAAIQRDASASLARKRVFVTPGQKCPHCSAPLDAGYIFRVGRAA